MRTLAELKPAADIPQPLPTRSAITPPPQSAPIANHARVFVTLLCLLLLPLIASAQVVELTAQVEVAIWKPESVSVRPGTIRCAVGTKTWRMEGGFIQHTESTWWFTGTNLIEQTELTEPIPGLPKGHRSLQVFASTDGNPGRPSHSRDLLTMPSARVIWLAFCSGGFLKRAGRQLYPPSDLWKELISAPAGFSNQTTVFEDTLGLPRAINLYTTNGQPVLQYRVTASTNVLGSEFPLEFLALPRSG